MDKFTREKLFDNAYLELEVFEGSKDSELDYVVAMGEEAYMRYKVFIEVFEMFDIIDDYVDYIFDLHGVKPLVI